MATYSNILAWKLPRTEESDGLQSMELQKVGHNLATINNNKAWLRKKRELKGKYRIQEEVTG